jgi:hypothetical protein
LFDVTASTDFAKEEIRRAEEEAIDKS